jgi:hypothetical protein
MIKKTLLAATLLAVTSAAQAELVEFDWETAGDGNVTLDTQSGNIWLDLDITGNMTINEVKSLVDSDLRFAGWRLPTTEEVHELAANIFNVDASKNYHGVKTISNEDKIEHALFDYPYTTSSVYGLYEKDGGSYLFGSGNNGLYLNHPFAYHLDYKRVYEGVYLVSTDYNTAYDAVSINERMNSGISDVSAPVALGTFGLILGLAGMRLRKSS